MIIKLDDLIRQTQGETGTRVNILLVGDFNRHDQLWGGDDVYPNRQGEADLIIDLMSRRSLCSMLPRGTKTWQGPHSESTIDLVLASAELAEEIIKCTTHATEHGSDHRAIESSFNIAVPERSAEPRLLFKNTL